MPGKQIEPRPFTPGELEAMDFVIEALFPTTSVEDKGDPYLLCQPYLQLMGRLIATLAEMHELEVDTLDRDLLLDKIERIRQNIEYILHSNYQQRQPYQQRTLRPKGGAA